MNTHESSKPVKASPRGRQPKETSLEIENAYAGFHRAMFFNRFRLTEMETGHLLAEFFLLVGQMVVDSYACVLLKPVIKAHELEFARYLGGMPPATDRESPVLESWQRAPTNSVDVPTVMKAGRVNEFAELALFDLSLVMGFGWAKKTAKTANSEPVALLRSDVDVQRALLVEIFGRS